MFPKKMKDGRLLLSVVTTGVLFAFASCAQDGFDEDEAFQHDVRNTQLVSPDKEQIQITPTADMSRMTLSWPTVVGASAFDVNLSYELDGKTVFVVDSIIDGNSFAVSRVEDVRYTFSIKTLANTSLGNSDAAQATLLTFLTVAPSYATIPSGTDLADYFEQNPAPTGETDIVMYDLEIGGHYTLSKQINFGMAYVGLRTAVSDNKATITYSDNATLTFGNGLTLKNVIIDASASYSPLLSLSKTGYEELPATSSFVIMSNALVITGCSISGVREAFIKDNGVNYCIATFSIDNSIINFGSEKEGIDGSALFNLKNAMANDLTISNSTLYNTGSLNGKYMIQYSNNARCDRAGFVSNSVNIKNCTFYNMVAGGQIANYSGFGGKKTTFFVLTDNIFVACCADIARRFVAGNVGNANAAFANNTYMNADGTFQTTDGTDGRYDMSGTAIESDPQLADPASGDFSVGGSEQRTRATGDPRWLK